jgi:hypothetical protein
MIVNFDLFNRPERPELILSNPNKSYISPLENAFNINLDLKFNDISELSFEIPYKKDNIITPFYDQIIGKKLILFKNITWFKIYEVNTIGDGIKETKQVKAYSLEVEIAQKKITAFNGTFKFYDTISPSGTLMYEIVSMLKGWTLGSIDSSLWDKYRTFQVSDQNLYNFLMSDVEQSYECFFTFDTFNKKINAYSISNYVNNTSIYLSFDNLLKQTEVTEISSEIITCLSVYGGNELDIHSVNSLGDNKIYNFSYYKNTDWMEQSLIDAITTWENKIATNQTTYSSKLITLKDKNTTLLTKENELIDLESELTALIGVKKARIEQGLSLTDINSQISSKRSQISTKENEITQLESEISVIKADLLNINNTLKIENNFTSTQLVVLDGFIYEETYQNDSFIITDSMTLVEQQDMAQQLYEQGVRVLSKISQPKYKFEVDSVNFLHLEEFQDYHSQLNLGSILNVELKEGAMSYPICLQISINYENDDFSMVFGNRYRLDDSTFVFSDLFENAFKAGSSVSFDKYLYTDWTKNNKDEVTTFINSSLDATKNNLINNSNQEIKIDSNGLRGKQYDVNIGGYTPYECWLTSSTLAFSNDNFNTAKLALGKIIDPMGSSVYGLVADVIVGKMVASNSLLITNSNNKFRVDATGATLVDASFTLTTTDAKSKAILTPSSIKFQGNVGGTWTDQLYYSNGNLKIKGELVAGSIVSNSTISGGSLNINNNCIINSSGYLTATGATLTGEINATSGTITGSLVVSGGAIKTASSGERLELSTNQLKSYNSSNIKNGFCIEKYLSVYAGLMYRSGTILGGMADFGDNSLTIYSNANLGTYGQDLILSGGRNLILKEGDYGIVCVGSATASNRVVVEDDLSGYLQSGDVYSKSYIDSNFADISHTHGNTYVKTMSSQNLKLQAFDGAEVNYVEVWLGSTYLGQIDLY